MDIGAHVGAFTLFAAGRATQARIIAVEPEQGNFALLKRNIEMNGFTGRIAAENIGIGSGEDSPLYDASGEHRSEPVALGSSGEPLLIHTVTLAALLEKYSVARLDLLRLDCEGAEYDALYSLSDDTLRRIRCIAMEYHHVTLNPAYRSDTLIAFLTSKSFRVIQHRESMLIAVHN
jgi:FkbM family methyltransferase